MKINVLQSSGVFREKLPSVLYLRILVILFHLASD
jgi:hypothetical protein